MKKLRFRLVPTSSLLILSFLFFLWRLGLFLIAWIGAKYFAFEPSFPYSDIFLIPSKLPRFIWSFGNFDGVHYLTIATSGYTAQFTQVFFPVYPILVRILHLVSPFHLILNALFLSSVFFLLTMIMFYKLLRMDYKSNVSLWAVGFMLAFPTSFFFGSIYTESLFLFLVISSFYFARKSHWFLAIFLAAVSTGTRIVGLALIPALFIEWYIQFHRSSTIIRIVSERFSQRKNSLGYTRSDRILFGLFFIPSGLLFYMLYLQKTFHDPLYFWHAQSVFGAQRSGASIILLPQVFVRYIKIFKTVDPRREIFFVSLNEFIMTVAALNILFFAYVKKVRLSYLVFSSIAFILPTLTGTLSSMPRYILIVFPLYIVAALIRSPAIKLALLCASCILLGVFTIVFTRGHWLS